MRAHRSAIQRETPGRDDDEEERREEAEAAASWQRYLDATRERDAFAEGCALIFAIRISHQRAHVWRRRAMPPSKIDFRSEIHAFEILRVFIHTDAPPTCLIWSPWRHAPMNSWSNGNRHLHPRHLLHLIRLPPYQHQRHHRHRPPRPRQIHHPLPRRCCCSTDWTPRRAPITFAATPNDARPTRRRSESTTNARCVCARVCMCGWDHSQECVSAGVCVAMQNIFGVL